MFKLVAVFFLLTNGVPADKPAGALSYHSTFASEAECKAFPKTKEGKLVVKAVEDFVKAKKVSVAVRIACMKAQTEDNSI